MSTHISNDEMVFCCLLLVVHIASYPVVSLVAKTQPGGHREESHVSAARTSHLQES